MWEQHVRKGGHASLLVNKLACECSCLRLTCPVQQSSKDLDLSGAAGMSSTADILKGRPGMSEHSQWYVVQTLI
jgi:hypothetical protein